MKQKGDSVMKTRIARTGLILGLGAASVIAMAVIAESPALDGTVAEVAANAGPDDAENAPPADLSSNVEDILKLNRAQVGDEVTLNYIQNSGTVYNLSEKDVAYLRSEGVSQQVIDAMSGLLPGASADLPEPAFSQVPAPSADYSVPEPEDTVASSMPAYTQPGQPFPTYIQPVQIAMPVAVQPAPEPPRSTLYIIPDPASGATAHFYPSGYARPAAFASTVFTIGGGSSGRRYYSTGYHGGHSHGVCVIGRR